jgi:hypothetical protein
VLPAGDLTGPGQVVRLSDNPRFVDVVPVTVTTNLTISSALLTFVVTDPTGLTATVQWNSGVNSPATIVPIGDGRFAVEGQYTFGANASYNVTVTLARDGQVVGSYVNDIQVSGANTQDTFFLQRIYQLLLTRVIEPAALDYWYGELTQGASRTQVVQAIEQSPEYETNAIQAMYIRLLRRPAEAQAVAGWLQFLSAGHSLDEVRVQILSSPEFDALSGGTEASYVSALYANLLGRLPDPYGGAAWVGALQAGATPFQVASAIQHSPEAGVYDVIVDYSLFLLRPAELAAIDYWVSLMQIGASAENVQAGILGSQEFLQGTAGQWPNEIQTV